MGDYTGGYTSALDSASRRGVEDAQRQQLLQALIQQQQEYQQKQQERQRQMQGRRVIEQLLPQLAGLGQQGGGPQPPAPGAPSVPMAPPGPPQGGGMPSMPPPPGAPPVGMPGMPPGGSPVGMPSMPPPPAQGAPMAKAGGPGAPMPAGAPPPGAAPPMPPQGWQALPKPPEGPGAGPGGIPPPPEDAVMPRQQLSVGDLAKFLDSKGIKGADALAAIEQWKPYMDTQNKAELDAMKVKYQAQSAALKAYQQVLRDAEHARHDKAMEGAASDRNRIAANRPRGGSAGAGGKPTWSADTIDYYAQRAIAGDNTWRVGLSRTGQGATNIGAVDERVAELSAERGSTPTGDVANRAQRTATERALNERTKFVAAGQQFVRNFQKQADLVEKYLKPGVAGDVPAINKWIQAGRKKIEGDPDVTAFDTAIRGLAREHQRIVTGVTSNAQLHVSAQETADELLNKDMSAPQIQATLKVMREEAENAVSSGLEEVGDLKSQLKTIGTAESVREFPTEAAALAAKLTPGTKVKINGRSATIQ